MRTWTWILPIAALAWLLTQPVQAATEAIEMTDFRADIGKVAKRIREVVAGEKQDAVEVRQFVGPRLANTGGGIEDLLTQAIEGEAKGFVKNKAAISLQGEFDFIDDPLDNSRVVMQLTVRLKDKSAKNLAEFVSHVRNNRDIAQFAGVTGSLTPDGTAKERNQEIKKTLDSPQAHLEGNLVRAKQGSQLGVELRAKKSSDKGAAAVREPVIADGEAFVNIPQGDVYEVVVHNGSAAEVAVALTIDGFDAFAFSEVKDDQNKRPRYTHYIVPARSSTTIVGWHLRDAAPNNYASFLVTELGKGASAKAARPTQGKVGILQVAFSQCFPAGTSRSGSETGFGPPVSVKVEPVKRAIDPPHEFISIRYNRDGKLPE